MTYPLCLISQCILLHIQTSLDTNGPTGADVPISCKQANKNVLPGDKSEVTPHVSQSSLNELVSHYDGYTRIFTNGSQIGDAVGATAIVGSQVSKKRVPNGSSIFSAEARELPMALDMVRQSSDRQLLYLCDSLVVSAKPQKSSSVFPAYCWLSMSGA